jgi:small-conductance mechanosensitive channel
LQFLEPLEIVRVRLALLLIVAAVAAFCALPAAAQLPAEPAADAEAAAADADIEALIALLENDEARARLVERLRATAAEAEIAEPSFASTLAGYTRSAAGVALSAAAALAELVRQASGVFTGAVDVDFPALRAVLLGIVLLIAATFTIYLLLRVLFRRFASRLADRAVVGDYVVRFRSIVLRAALDIGSVLLAWSAGNGIALVLGQRGEGGVELNLFLNAFLIVELLKAVARTLLSPAWPSLRIVPMEDTNAAYWYFWLSRLVSLVGYTFLFIGPLLATAVSVELAEAVRIVVMFIALAVSIAIVLQNRDAVRQRLLRWSGAGGASIRSRPLVTLARVWHVLAIFYLIAVFVLWVTDPEASLRFALRATLESAVAILVGAFLSAALGRLAATGLRLSDDVKARLPLLEARLNAFVPNVLRVVRTVIALAVLVMLVQIWRLADVGAWLASELGQRVLTAAISVALILVFAGVIYLAVQSWIEWRLNPSAGMTATARERTLLALFRNAFTIVLGVLVFMLILSELGVNIGPLLAGAGVIGLAVGFGAQKLVQDVITGAFIQLEDTMNEGDVITAGGITGVVERLTIRSVSLRSLDGAYHLIPFSSVDTVTNVMKHFSYHVAAMGVAYRESIPEVKQAMRDAFEKLKATPFGADIIDDFEMQGLTEFADSAIVVRARIKTLPGKHFALGRAYNEILKEVFDERGIEIPFPHVTLYMGELKDGTAPPLTVRAAT